jgi:hypothetical protein
MGQEPMVRVPDHRMARLLAAAGLTTTAWSVWLVTQARRAVVRTRRARALRAVARAAAEVPMPGGPVGRTAALSLALGMAARAGRDAEAAPLLDELLDEAAAGAEQLGQALGSQDSPLVIEHGLASALDADAAWIAGVLGTDVSVSCDLGEPLGDRLEPAVHRVAQQLMGDVAATPGVPAELRVGRAGGDVVLSLRRRAQARPGGTARARGRAWAIARMLRGSGVQGRVEVTGGRDATTVTVTLDTRATVASGRSRLRA